MLLLMLLHSLSKRTTFNQNVGLLKRLIGNIFPVNFKCFLPFEEMCPFYWRYDTDIQCLDKWSGQMITFGCPQAKLDCQFAQRYSLTVTFWLGSVMDSFGPAAKPIREHFGQKGKNTASLKPDQIMMVKNDFVIGKRNVVPTDKCADNKWY